MSLPIRAMRFISLLAATGALAASVLAMLIGVEPIGSMSIALFVATALAAGIPLRLRDGPTAAFNLGEAVLVAMLFVLPAGQVALLYGTANAIAHARRRVGVAKVAFNAGSVTVGAVVATIVFHAIGPADSVMDPRSILAIVSAALVHNTVTLLALAELFRRLDGRSLQETIRSSWRLNTATLAGNTSFGLLLAFVARVDAAATVLASTLMVGLYIGYRGYARALEEGRRAHQLHEVTRTLSAATSSPEAGGRFVDGVAQLFGASSAELVLVRDDRIQRLARGGEGAGELEDLTAVSVAVARALEAEEPILVRDARDGEVGSIAAPLEIDDETVGAIAVHGRRGLEPWDDADLSLLASLANEAALAVRNVELVADLEHESRTLGTIIGAASDGIAFIDRSGTVVTWNAAMAAITGIPEDEAVGHRWNVIVRLADEDASARSALAIDLALRGAGLDLPIDLSVLRGNEDARWLRCTISPVEQGSLAGAVLVARDVTAEHEAEQLKQDFLATVSHELRTPLTPLRGFLDTVASRWGELDDGQVEQIWSAMRRQVDRLEALVADLLLVADLERGSASVERRTVDLAAVADSVADGLGPEAAGRLRVRAGPPVLVVADPDAVHRVVTALVDNAVKHTQGPIALEVSEGADGASLSVIDDGPGIPAWERERVFEPFARLGDHLTRPTQGPGLGLAIARRLADAVGGRLVVSSTRGGGSSFALLLPAVSDDLDLLHVDA